MAGDSESGGNIMIFFFLSKLFIKTITNYCVALDVDIIQFPGNKLVAFF